MLLPQLATAIGVLADDVSTPDFGSDSVAEDSAPTMDIPYQAMGDTTTMLPLDSVLPQIEPIAADTQVVPDTFTPIFRPVVDKVDLETAVDFASSDSLVIIRRDSAMMYGNSTITYGDIKLQSANIEMDMHTNTVYAVGVEDSVGDMTGQPVFNDGSADYQAATMRYNFISEKGFITNVVTEQGEGFLTGGRTKRTDDGNFFIENGRYTTCDDHDCPHFYFNVTRGKVHPGSNIVTGPAYMVLAGLPLPIAVPFGYFPFTSKYKSGILVPSFGDDYQRGFYLRDGGYYFAINDNIDLALTGEIYTKGSWGINANSNYVRRYRYSGSFQINYLKSIYGDKGAPDYSSQTNFQLLWSHSQDAKANPNLTLSASVNFTTSGYSRNDLNSYYSNSFTENTKSSTVNMTYRFPQSKWSLSASMNVSQRTQDSTLSVSFPNLNITLAQVYPFKRKRAAGDERWYEKIRLSYTGQFQNSLTAQQNVFFKKSLIKDWRNAFRHNIPISATFNAFSYLNITPSINFTDRMYTQKVRRQWDPAASAEVCDTTYSFYNVYDFSAALSLDTKVYGFWRPLGFLGKKLKMIRHVFTPSVSISAAPDFGSSFFGYYGHYDYTDSQGRPQTKTYSYFPNALYGTPAQGKQGVVSWSLANNLEAKVLTNDSIGEKKISLIENFTLTQSYNFAADSLNFSNINTSMLLRLTKNFNLNLNATWDVYTYQLNSAGNPVRVNKLRWNCGKGIGRLSSTGTSFSYTFNQDTFRRKNSSNNNNSTPGNGSSTSAPPSGEESAQRRDDAAAGDLQLTPEGYVPWRVPWSLTFNYSINYAYGTFNKEKMEYNGKVTQNLSLSGSIKPTPNWNFSFTASYDFDRHKLAYMNCNIGRDLHCFQMRASFVPVGPYKNYTFNIAVKSSMLADLKYDKRSSISNGVSWY